MIPIEKRPVRRTPAFRKDIIGRFPNFLGYEIWVERAIPFQLLACQAFDPLHGLSASRQDFSGSESGEEVFVEELFFRIMLGVAFAWVLKARFMVAALV